MQRRRREWLRRGMVVLSVCSGFAIYGADYFVTPKGSGTICSADAPCALATAIGIASGGDRIALAAGTYTGSGDNVVELREGISLYGGWDGNNPPTVNPDKYITTLSGENERRVIEVNGTGIFGISTTLDGLHIVDGNATGLGGYTTPSGDIHDAGGGILAIEANVSITNSTIEHNDGGIYGGGVFLHSSTGRIGDNLIQHNYAQAGGGIAMVDGSPIVSENKVIRNNVLSRGGGIDCTRGSSLITHNLIHDNNASRGYGGGISLSNTHAILKNNSIMRNHAYGSGGGIALGYIEESEYSNNIVADNSAGNHGGGIQSYGSHNLRLKHNTIANNQDADSGTGIYLTQSGSHDCNMTLVDTIIANEEVGIYVTDNCHASLEGTLFWENGDNIMRTTGASVEEGSITVSGNPAFKDPANGDYHITGFSAAIDAGVDAGVTEDIDGDPRPMGAGYDIGADETPRTTLAPIYYLLF